LETDHTLYQLAQVIDEYKSEEHILAGKTIDKEDLDYRTEQTYWEREDESSMDSVAMEELTEEIMEDISKEVKESLIASDLKSYQYLLHELDKIEEPLYYVTDGEHTFTNTDATKREQFEKLPVYYI